MSDFAPLPARLDSENSRGAVGHFCGSIQLLFPAELPEADRLVLVLNGYFDDSGTHDGSDVVSVAGYISTFEQWRAFEREWQVCMEEWKPDHSTTPLVFHMTDYAVRKKPYSQWTDSDYRFRFSRLVKIINDHVIASVGVAVPLTAFNQIFPKEAKRFVGGAYGLAAHACFSEAAKLISEGFPSARIAYVFEGGTKGSGQVKKIYDFNSGDPEQSANLKLLGALTFGSKAMPQIQAADIIAYELYKFLPFVLGMKKDHGPRLGDMRSLSECGLRSWLRLDSDKELFKWAAIATASAMSHGAGGPRRRGMRK